MHIERDDIGFKKNRNKNTLMFPYVVNKWLKDIGIAKYTKVIDTHSEMEK
jgi:hypothetical protein